MKRVKIPVEAVHEIKKLQYQIEQIMLDLETKCQRLKVLEEENRELKCDIESVMLNGMSKKIAEKYDHCN